MITDGKLLIGASCSPDSWNGNTLLVGRIVELFYADEVDDPHSVELALSICEGCPVVDRCLDAGIDEEYGVWGGTTAEERITIRKGRRAAKRRA
jgi:hypothetical protein